MGRAIVRVPKRLPDGRAAVEPRREAARADARRHRRRCRRDFGVTTVYVTHDQSEAMTLGHRVAVLKDGELQQCDTPRALYEHAREHIRRGLHRLAGDESLTVPLGSNGVGVARRRAGTLPESVRAAAAAAGGTSSTVGVRPEALELAGEGIAAEVRSSRRSAPTRTSSAPPRWPGPSCGSSRGRPHGSRPPGARASRSVPFRGGASLRSRLRRANRLKGGNQVAFATWLLVGAAPPSGGQTAFRDPGPMRQPNDRRTLGERPHPCRRDLSCDGSESSSPCCASSSHSWSWPC